MRLIPIALAAALALPAAAQRNLTLPEPYAITGVRMACDKDAPRHTLLLQGGRIEAVQPEDFSPGPAYRVLDGSQLIALPAFVDAFGREGLTLPENQVEQDMPLDTSEDVRVDMRLANRKGIRPALLSADFWNIDAKARETRLKGGFSAMLAAPHGEILSGRSALVLLNGGARRDAVLNPEVMGHASFRASGEGYPSTLMGYHAQFRQFFMDAGWQGELAERRAAGQDVVRAAFDPDLIEGRRYLAGELPLLCEADTARDILRWISLADEFGLHIGIAGGRDAWQVAGELAQRHIPVVLTLDWSDEPDDPDKPKDKKGGRERGGKGGAASGEEKSEGPETEGSKPEETKKDEKVKESDPYTYTEPLALQRERRRLWELQRDNALRLREAGVQVVFGTGDGDLERLQKNLRTLTENGMASAELIQILSEDSARLLGATRDLGALAEGRAATFNLWSDDPFAQKARVAVAFVDGIATRFPEPKEGKGGKDAAKDESLAGTWDLEFGDSWPELHVTIVLTEDESKTLRGTWTGTNEGAQLGERSFEATFEEGTLRFETDSDVRGSTVTLTVEARLEEGSLTGSANGAGPEGPIVFPFTATRKPEGGAQ
ncbi:MAG: amidohydrolase family protein [Planctomycetota bacterium]